RAVHPGGSERAEHRSRPGGSRLARVQRASLDRARDVATAAPPRRRLRRAPFRSEEAQAGGGAGAELVEVDLDALDAAALGEHARLGLDPRRDEDAVGRRVRRIAVEALLVAQQLLDARDLADALDLDDDGAAVAIAAQQVDGADVGGE